MTLKEQIVEHALTVFLDERHFAEKIRFRASSSDSWREIVADVNELETREPQFGANTKDLPRLGTVHVANNDTTGILTLAIDVSQIEIDGDIYVCRRTTDDRQGLRTIAIELVEEMRKSPADYEELIG